MFSLNQFHLNYRDLNHHALVDYSQAALDFIALLSSGFASGPL